MIRARMVVAMIGAQMNHPVGRPAYLLMHLGYGLASPEFPGERPVCRLGAEGGGALPQSSSSSLRLRFCLRPA